MTTALSAFGQKLSAHSGINELMHDLGSALKDGGNPFAPGAAKTIGDLDLRNGTIRIRFRRHHGRRKFRRA